MLITRSCLPKLLIAKVVYRFYIISCILQLLVICTHPSMDLQMGPTIQFMPAIRNLRRRNRRRNKGPSQFHEEKAVRARTVMRWTEISAVGKKPMSVWDDEVSWKVCVCSKCSEHSHTVRMCTHLLAMAFTSLHLLKRCLVFILAGILVKWLALLLHNEKVRGLTASQEGQGPFCVEITCSPVV